MSSLWSFIKSSTCSTLLLWVRLPKRLLLLILILLDYPKGARSVRLAQVPWARFSD